MSTANKARFLDLTLEDIYVLSDMVKDQGLGIREAAEVGPPGLAYLCYCPPEVEQMFASVFPCKLGRKAAAGGDASRLVWLFEEVALRAVLTAFGITGSRLDYYVHPMQMYAVSYVKWLDGKKYLGP
jgi:hypothetical protein